MRYSQRWHDDISKMKKNLKLLDQNNFIEIRYEDLLKEPIVTITKCLNLLNIESSKHKIKGLLVFEKSPENLGGAKGHLEIKSDNINRYKESLSAKKIEKIEKITWPLLKHYGYEYNKNYIKKNRLNIFILSVYKTSDIINRIIFDLRNHGLKNYKFVFLQKILSYKK